MSIITKKISNSLKREGFLKTAVKIAVYPIRMMAYPFQALKQGHFVKKLLRFESVEDRFTWIYQSHHWAVSATASGPGSTLKYTENLRKELPELLNRFSIKKIFDAPCGDFNWMKHVLPKIDADYLGGDIVRPLIELHNEKYKSTRVSFVKIDLTKDLFPKCDLMICRDCLFHLSYKDTKSVLKNFVDSDIPYLLTTTHKKNFSWSNRDIHSGDFRLMDLFSAPYNFPVSPLAAIDDWIAPDPERQMCLWSKEQVVLALAKFGQSAKRASADQ